ncbi:uncharacterized protein LOC131324691 [Rhododendron vialii]|uniref:uncharacterized protein LOC131324691 n=1 Tax=Rhododendron vialii TaxID=182163 RepID=UPI00266020E7|nr:uncharacterized protein LOC131324691 [Rhododendron vialii]
MVFSVRGKLWFEGIKGKWYNYVVALNNCVMGLVASLFNYVENRECDKDDGATAGGNGHIKRVMQPAVQAAIHPYQVIMNLGALREVILMRMMQSRGARDQRIFKNFNGE